MPAAACRPADHRRDLAVPAVAARRPALTPTDVRGDPVRPLAHALRRCPSCQAGHLQAVFDGNRVNVLCTSCGGCWNALGHRACRVDPETCPGCPARGWCRAAPESPAPLTAA